ncbi:RES family NAD+ phosphorylase [Aquimonas voraii]|uniref:RES domain-containing protein n=1 Tax=Aquimonas voraii TaxID=265719 RepID=A0A1G6Y2X1_9GAMM|nr:RES family NAD+ phosphorylase [Aquimonas voraii]SDD83946.1 RES domain-containing protein [Aquimonas voraii]
MRRSDPATPPLAAVVWRPSHRIVPSIFPPRGLFDAVADPADLDAVFALEALTNDRLREQLGHLRRIPPERRVSGPGTTPVMSAFTHVHPDGGRFSTAKFGAYYAARELPTAIAETVYHRERFLRASKEPPIDLQMRSYQGNIRADLHDVRGGDWPRLHDPYSYAISQAFATRLRDKGSEGIVFDSVRKPGGQCVALFYPDLIGPVKQGPHLLYRWDGARIEAFIQAG